MGKLQDKVAIVTGGARGMGAATSRIFAAEGAKIVIADVLDAEGTALAAEIGAAARWRHHDVTDEQSWAALVEFAKAEFGGRIDVLVNNAGSSFKGFFEEMTPAQVERQLAINLLGPMNVTRAVLPVMRRQRSGHVISISSGAGLVAFEYSSVYAASKFGLEGWMGALHQEVAPFGIHTTIVNPGWFRTDLIRLEPSYWPQLSIDDYAERSAAQREWWEAQNGKQSGDPAKLAKALLTIAAREPPPQRFIAGADAIALAEQKIADLKAQIDTGRGLPTSLDIDEH